MLSHVCTLEPTARVHVAPPLAPDSPDQIEAELQKRDRGNIKLNLPVPSHLQFSPFAN